MRHIAAVALLTCSSFGKERALLLRFVQLSELKIDSAKLAETEVPWGLEKDGN